MIGLRAVAAAFTLCCSLDAAVAQADGPAWLATPDTAFDHQDAAAVALDGGKRALVIGGLHWTGSAFEQQHVERYDLASNRWTTAASSPDPLRDAGAVVLRDGRVLVAGTWLYPELEQTTADLYSPATDSWTRAEPLLAPRDSPRLVLLDDGRALAVGGSLFSLSEAYDPASGHWTADSAGTPREEPAVAKLPDGRVLAAGGAHIYDDYASADLYDPSTRTWTPVAAMHIPRRSATAATLPDGRVLVAGGYRDSPVTGDRPEGTYEIYDPAADTWTAPAPLSRPRRFEARMVTLSDGRLVITGGSNDDVDDAPYGGEQATADVYDPRTGAWTTTPPTPFGRSEHVAIALADDSVLVAGGVFVNRSSARLVVPTPTPTPTVTPLPTPTPTVTPTPEPAVTTAPPPPTSTPLQSRPKAVLAAAAHLRAKRGTVTVKVRCTGAGTCADALTLRLRGGRMLAHARVRVMSGKTRTVRLTLSKAERRRLAGRTTKVTLTLGTTTRTATLRV